MGFIVMDCVPPGLNCCDLLYHRSWRCEIFVNSFKDPIFDMDQLPMSFVNNDIISIVLEALHKHQIFLFLNLVPHILPSLSLMVLWSRLMRLILLFQDVHRLLFQTWVLLKSLVLESKSFIFLNLLFTDLLLVG